MFWAEIWKYQSFLSENFQCLEIKFSTYLNRYVFVMDFAISAKEGSFCQFLFSVLNTKSLLKRTSTLKKKEFASLWMTLFSFRVHSFSDGRLTNLIKFLPWKFISSRWYLHVFRTVELKRHYLTYQCKITGKLSSFRVSMKVKYRQLYVCVVTMHKLPIAGHRLLKTFCHILQYL